MGKGKPMPLDDDLKQVRCSRCKQWKSKDEFNRRNKRLNLLQYVCRDCQQQQGRERYAKDKVHVRQINDTAKKLGQQKARDYVYYEVLPTLQCADCGTTDPRVLTFDHVRGSKRYDIGDMVSRGMALDSIKAELEKTECVCHNCHAIRTQKRHGFFRGWLPFLRKR
jgi:hypothetical protein